MKYYKEIKQSIEAKTKYYQIKEYNRNINDLKIYYQIGEYLSKELKGAEDKTNILKEYESSLKKEIQKGYNWHNLYNMTLYYKLVNKNNTLKNITSLTWSHYTELLPLKDINKINYYINMTILQNLPYRTLKEKIKQNTYEKAGSPQITLIEELVPKEIIKQNILEDIDNFLLAVGKNIAYISSDSKRYKDIDLLLYDINTSTYILVQIGVKKPLKEDKNKINKYITKYNNTKTKIRGIIITKTDTNYQILYKTNTKAKKIS